MVFNIVKREMKYVLWKGNEGEYIHKPEHAENEDWKLLWSDCDE